MLVWTDCWKHSEAGWNHCLTPREIQSVVSANEQPGQWFTHGHRDVRFCQSQALGDAGTQQPRQVQGGWRGTDSRAGRLSFSVSFLWLPTKKQVLLIYRRRKSLEGQITFFLQALIVSNPLGTSDPMRASFSPTLECTAAIINLVIYDSDFQPFPWAIHLLCKKKRSQKLSKRICTHNSTREKNKI